MARRLEFRLTGKPKGCNACHMIKAKVQSIPKRTLVITNKVRQRMGLDITGPFPLTYGKRHKAIKKKIFWYGLADHYFSKMINIFRHSKSDLVDFINEACGFMKSRGTPIVTIRMDNVGENQAVLNLCKKKLGIKVKITPPDTPKLNGISERAFAIRWERAKILMQNTEMRDSVNKNKKILIKAIATSGFLTE